MNIKYKSVRIRSETYKKLKLLSVELEIPVVKIIDMLCDKHANEVESHPPHP